MQRATAMEAVTVEVLYEKLVVLVRSDRCAGCVMLVERSVCFLHVATRQEYWPISSRMLLLFHRIPCLGPDIGPFPLLRK